MGFCYQVKNVTDLFIDSSGLMVLECVLHAVCIARCGIRTSIGVTSVSFQGCACNIFLWHIVRDNQIFTKAVGNDMDGFFCNMRNCYFLILPCVCKRTPGDKWRTSSLIFIPQNGMKAKYCIQGNHANSVFLEPPQ